MSWQAAMLAGLALVLVAGFAWYERSRPPARLIALVAALSALAVAGRLAFAPIPNVMATTDIALLSGYALGPGPGFVVGALAAPISNIWLGQGPWTGWEMAGWGMAGLLGAGLASLAGREAPRLLLALACGAAGLAYGALLDLSVMVTYGGEQSLDRYLALAARGLPFNVAHAAGNFALALAAGPALVRMLCRYRVRLSFSWRPAAASAALALVAAAPLAAPPGAEAAGIDRARGWLQRAQASDGGYAFEPGSPTSPKMTAWAMLGLEAAGRNPLDVRTGGTSPVDYLRANVRKLIGDTGTLELAVLGLEGAGVNSRSFSGRDLVRRLLRRQSGDGSFAGQVNLTAYGILALRAAGASSGVSEAVGWLRSARNPDGGWGIGRDRPSDPDSTGSALQGLSAAGSGGSGDGVAYLRRTQRRSGGWGIAETGQVNSQSTAFAVMGLVATGTDPSGVARNGESGPSYLASRQAPDGHYRYSRRSDQTPVWVTSQALLAASREALPIEPVPRSTARSTDPAPDVGSAEDAEADSPDPRPPSSEASAGDGSAGSREGRRSPGPGADERGRERPDAENRRAGGAKRPARAARRGSGRRQGDRRRIGSGESVAGQRPLAGVGSDSGAGSGLALPLLGGLGGLALALAGGFAWYRRRLP